MLKKPDGLPVADWIEMNMTQRGGWTKEFFESVGIAWPPKAGWKRKLIDNEINDEWTRILKSNFTTTKNS